MQLTLLQGYPDLVGRRANFAGSGVGPTSYNQTTGDVVSIPRQYIDVLFGGVQDTTGTYTLQARPSLAGSRASWALHWFVTATGAEVANAVNLSAFSVVVGGFYGQY